MRRGIPVLLAAVAAGSLEAQQPPRSPNDFVLRGQVISEIDGAPLRRASVDVAAGNERVASIFTDNEGRFLIDASARGPLTVTVGKGGYATARTLFDRDKAPAPMTVRLPRGAAIAGRVLTQGGAPAVASAVTARRLDPAAPGFPQYFVTTTDDLGAYRLAGLPPGRFEIAAGRPPQTVPPALMILAWNSDSASADPLRVQNERLFGGTVVSATPPSPPVRYVTTKNAAGILTTTIIQDSLAVQTVSVSTGEEITTPDMTVTAAEPLRVVFPGDLELSPRPAGSGGVIRGRVITDTGEPVVNAVVSATLVQPAAASSVARGGTTDGDGTFELRSLVAGTYTLRVSTAGRANAVYGQQRPDDAGRTITVSTGRTVEGIEVVMPRGRAIAGIVTDEHGEPLQGALVQALQIRDAGGRLTVVPASSLRRTDDRGRYRLFPLAPGDYVVVSAPEHGYAPVFYPGMPLVDGALPVVVNGDATGVNIAVVPSRTATIRGSALDNGRPLIAGTARLLVSGPGRIALELPPARLKEDGSFLFANVPRGEYAVQVQGSGPGRTGLFGVGRVSVSDADPVPLTIATSHGTTLEGRIVFEGARDGESPSPMMFSVAAIALDPDRARPEGGGGFVVSSEGTFYMSGLFGPMAFALRRAPVDGWYLKSLTVNGLDVTDSSVDFESGPRTVSDAEMVLSRSGATISGRAVDRQAPVSSYAVVVFPVFRDQWVPHSRRLRFAPSGHDGAFRITGLPPGDYYVAAVDRLSGTAESGEWQNADVLTRLVTTSERVTIREGESRDLTLRLGRR